MLRLARFCFVTFGYTRPSGVLAARGAAEAASRTPAANPPTGPAYDLVLLAHIAVALVALATVTVSAVQALRLRRALAAGPGRPAGTEPAALSESLSESLRRYYQPGVNWAGRSLYAVPVLGFVLLGMSKGAFGLADRWVMIGLALWAAAALVAEGALWPAEQQLRRALDGRAAPENDRFERSPAAQCATVVRSATGVAAVLVAAMVIMVAQP